MRGRSVVDHAVDHQLAHEPSIHRLPAGEGEEHKRRADRVEPALRSILNEAAALETSLTWKQVGKNLLLYGYAVVETSVDGDCLAKRRNKPRKLRGESAEEFAQRISVWEHQRKTMMPFRTVAHHPARILLDPLRKDPRMGVRHDYRTAYDLYLLTQTRADQRNSKGRNVEVTVYDYGDNPYKMVECDEYWSEQWHAMATTAGDMLFVERNSWGFIPYAHAFAGYGQEPTEQEEFNPSFLAVGILDHARDTLKAQAQESAARHNAVIEAAFNPMVTTGDAAELQEQRARGDILEVANRGEVGWMEVQQLPRYVFESEQMIDRDLELGTYAQSLAGIREQGVSTVGQQAILSTAASRKFATASKQLEHLASRSGMHILRLIDTMKLSLIVEGHEISGADIEKDYQVKVSFELVDPVIQFQARELGLREVQAGVKSKETYWSADARLEDATGERHRLLVDSIREDPMIQRILAKEAAREEGLLEMLQQEEELQAQQEQQGMPGEQSMVDSMMGGGPGFGPDGSPGGGGPGGRPTRQPITPDTARPSPVGQNLAG
tara:strand:- start:2507 stop:4162 length:1656 start_codon:yes stop_codon:yes gene_type:complete